MARDLTIATICLAVMASHPVASYTAAAIAAAAATVVTATADGASANANATHDRRLRHPLSALLSNLDNSWIENLNPETPDNLRRSLRVAADTDPTTNRRHGQDHPHPGRPVYNGHYVLVDPSPLRDPILIAHIPDVASDLGLTEDEVWSEEFLRFASGDVRGAFTRSPTESSSSSSSLSDSEGEEEEVLPVRTWATPYALSIMGRRYTSNCPYGTGDGYGDGRAISVGEFLLPSPSQDAFNASTPIADGSPRPPPPPRRLEIQLKGPGQTPFCRGADGRAVLRSSVREFVASEFMHRLGVPTARPLSLVVSNFDTVRRPWYSEDERGRGRERWPPGSSSASSFSGGSMTPSPDDPDWVRRYPDSSERRRALADRAAGMRSDPNVMIEEPVAIAARVSASFVRVGHFDLFARRAVAGSWIEEVVEEGSAERRWRRFRRYDVSSRAWKELERLFWHTTYREYYGDCHAPHVESGDVLSASFCLLRRSMEGLANTVAHWIRVGFVQGNFNADNCLVSGRTVDYGPFGFVDTYHPFAAKWTGSGEHYGFMNQPMAALANFRVLAESILPLAEERGRWDVDGASEALGQILNEAEELFQLRVRQTFRLKMGFQMDDDRSDGLWDNLEPLLTSCHADWTVFWRRLTEVAREFPVTAAAENGAADPPSSAAAHNFTPSTDYNSMLNVLSADDSAKEGSSPFYHQLDDEHREMMMRWIQSWREVLVNSYGGGRQGNHRPVTEKVSSKKEQEQVRNSIPPEERMRASNPKYVPREWMLVEAYTLASPALTDNGGGSSGGGGNDYSAIHELLELTQNPYDEGTEEQDRKYYRRTPTEALSAGGTAYMS